jgi:hypothetical protein
MILVPQILPVTAVDMQAAVALFQQLAPAGCAPRRDSRGHHAESWTDHIISSDAFDLVPGLIRVDPIVLYQSASPAKP